jgi:hypothetical protein
MIQLVKTFAQLTAGVLSVSVTAPVYNYYLKNFVTQSNSSQELDSDLEVEDRETEYDADGEEDVENNSTDVENDKFKDE